ncbi:MAG: hypothetical protein WCA31_07020, partial [Acidimicrobiales bacterium]
PALTVVGDGSDATEATYESDIDIDIVEDVGNPSRVKEFFSANDLLATTGLSPEEFNQLHALGLVSSVVVDGETCFSALDVRVAAHSRALLARGVDARLLGPLRRIAEREISVVDDLTVPLRQGAMGYSDDQVRAITADVAREVAALRSVLVERELHDYLQS